MKVMIILSTLLFTSFTQAEVEPTGCFEYQVVNRMFQGYVDLSGPEAIKIVWDQTSPWPLIDYGITDSLKISSDSIKARNTFLENSADGYTAHLTLTSDEFMIENARTYKVQAFKRIDCKW